MIVRMPSLARPMTLDEWYALDEDEPGEIVDGFLVEDEVPGYAHEFVIFWFAQVLRSWAVAHGAIVAGSGCKIAIRKDRGRMPDFNAYLAGAKRPRDARGHSRSTQHRRRSHHADAARSATRSKTVRDTAPLALTARDP